MTRTRLKELKSEYKKLTSGEKKEKFTKVKAVLNTNILPNGVTQIRLVGPIGGFLSGVRADDLFEALSVAQGDVEIFINSIGGDVVEAFDMVSQIKQYRALGRKVTAVLGAECASAATHVACACDEIQAFPHATFLIHKASAGLFGNEDDLQEAIELLREIDQTQRDFYMDKTDISNEQLIAYMSPETEFSAQEALEAGFVDLIIEDRQTLAMSDDKPDKQIDEEKESTETTGSEDSPVTDKIADNEEEEERKELEQDFHRLELEQSFVNLPSHESESTN